MGEVNDRQRVLADPSGRLITEGMPTIVKDTQGQKFKITPDKDDPNKEIVEVLKKPTRTKREAKAKKVIRSSRSQRPSADQQRLPAVDTMSKSQKPDVRKAKPNLGKAERNKKNFRNYHLPYTPDSPVEES